MVLTVPLLFAAILGALFRLGQARAFWTGMAICGWGYLLLVLAPWFEAGVGQYLPTSYLLNYVHGRQNGQLQARTVIVPGDTVDNFGNLFSTAADTTDRIKVWDATAGDVLRMTTATGRDAGLVHRTGHALFALLFGFIGGVTAKWFFLTRSPNGHKAGGE
jgi:hypothetical protein